MIDRLPFAAPLIYSPRGESRFAIRSRELRDGLKRGDPVLLPRIASHVSQLVSAGHFDGFFGEDVTLVPVPGSAPFVPGALWVPDRIARALQASGLAREIWPTLKRVHAVPKSAWARPGERPDIGQHMESLHLEDRLVPTARIVLVDDFVTKGRTLLAAASLIAQVLPDVHVRAFAVMRTMGLVPDIDRIRDPMVGEIRLEQGDAVRTP